MRVVSNYKSNRILSKSFMQLAKNTFGIEFSMWNRDGFWNDSYICFSYAEGERIISNASISKMNLCIDGHHVSGIQIGTVMTDPEYRGMGLSKKLMNSIFKAYSPDKYFIYLTAHKGVHEYYKKLGFIELVQNDYYMTPEEKLVKTGEGRFLNFGRSDDIDILKKLYADRRYVSDIIDVSDALHILMFYAYNGFEKNFYYIEKMNSIVVYEQVKGIVNIYDVISKSEINLPDVVKMLKIANPERINILFTPKLSDIFIHSEVQKNSDRLFVMGKNILQGLNFKYPAVYTS